jgi:glycosyltransferase involved in cell wall biosynthesis
LKIVVLYEELAWYFVNCLNVLAHDHNCSITVFCKKTNPNAPFLFKYVHSDIIIKDRSGFSETDLLQEVQNITPNVIFLGGWIYKPYLNVIKKSGIKNCILGIDNQWNGSFKQILGSIYFKLNLKSYINTVFVPGISQFTFAKKLGFAEDKISTGAYCCDYEFFRNAYEENKESKQVSFPKRFLFVGRYVKEKGITQLWDAFTELQKETPTDWELWCLGAGEILPVQHPKIKHFGFKQPGELGDIIKNTGVFVLPSLFEPWGVVVHEYATGGFPLLCSDKVGAIDTFLQDKKNGFIIASADKDAIKINLKKFIAMSQEELNLMSENSARTASLITPQLWAINFIKLYKNGAN